MSINLEPTVAGVGYFDVDYQVQGSKTVKGERVSWWIDPYYSRWSKLLSRCYSEKIHKIQKHYKECYVEDDWLYFSRFRDWMMTQDWEGKHLDKDILVPNNKMYSASTCVFVLPIINSFILNDHVTKGDTDIGYEFIERENLPYRALVNNPITRKKERLGNFDSREKAHFAWKSRKYQLVIELFNNGLITDDRVYQALLKRYQ